MKLSPRERRLVLGGAIFVGALALSQWVLIPMWNQTRRYERLSARRTLELRELRKLTSLYLTYKGKMAHIERRLVRKGDNFSLFTFLERAAVRAGIKDNLLSMKPSQSKVGEFYMESSVEVKFQGLSIERLVKYLYFIETAEKLLKIKRLQITASPHRPGTVDVTARVAAYSLISEAAEVPA
ncbi:MAG: type II secretion system protein GspM [Nitrospinota bacterium]